jgi:hypothetical protein
MMDRGAVGDLAVMADVVGGVSRTHSGQGVVRRSNIAGLTDNVSDNNNVAPVTAGAVEAQALSVAMKKSDW